MLEEMALALKGVMENGGGGAKGQLLAPSAEQHAAESGPPYWSCGGAWGRVLPAADEALNYPSLFLYSKE